MSVQACQMRNQAVEYRKDSLVSSIDSTAREIELYVAGLHRSLNIFASEERERLLAVISGNVNDATNINEKIRLHFPKHMAYAVSDPHVNTPFVSNLDLFGAHCQSSLTAHIDGRDSITSKPSIHNSSLPDTEHFDVVVNIPADDTTTTKGGLLFVSFPLDDLRRLLGTAKASYSSFFLHESSQHPAGDASTLLHSTHASSLITDSSSLSETDKSGFYGANVIGTPWVVAGSLETKDIYGIGVISIGPAIIAIMALLLAGLVAHQSVTQERSSQYRTAIVLDGIENDRKRIARELHDQVLSDASHAKRQLMDVATTGHATVSVPSSRLELILQSVEEFADGIRVAIDDLYPHTLENFGVVRAIEAHILGRGDGGPLVKLDLNNAVDLALAAGQRLHVFRIATELVDNALDHSKCQNLYISLDRLSDSIILRVEDDGQNDWTPGNVSPTGRGLTNIDARVIALGATSQWYPLPSGGARFEMKLSVDHVERN